jgi:hypothetical protein
LLHNDVPDDTDDCFFSLLFMEDTYDIEPVARRMIAAAAFSAPVSFRRYFHRLLRIGRLINYSSGLV